jgi:hypothetical protein
MDWTGARYPDTPTVEARTWIDAPPDRVWPLVSDIGLMPVKAGPWAFTRVKAASADGGRTGLTSGGHPS